MDAFSPEAFAAALEEVANMPSEAADKRRRAAFASVRGRFSVNQMVRALATVVREAGGPEW